MPDMNELIRAAARGTRIVLSPHRDKAMSDTDLATDERWREGAEGPTPKAGMNELLKAAHRADPDEALRRYRSAVAERQAAPGEVAGSADGGHRGPSPAPPGPSFGKVLNAMARDAIHGRAYGRGPSDILGLDDDE